MASQIPVAPVKQDKSSLADLAGLGIDVDRIKEETLGKSNPLAGAYREQLLAGRVKWRGGTIWTAIWHYIRTNHQLLSVCFGHREHPLGRGERFFVLLVDIMFRIFSSWISAIVTNRCDDEEFVDDDAAEDDASTNLFIAALLVSVMTSIFGFIMNYSATADDRCCGSQQGGLLKNCCTYTGRLVMCMVGCLAWMLGILGGVSLSDCPQYDAAEGVQVFFYSVLQGWSVTFIGLGVLMFSYQYYCADPGADAKHADKPEGDGNLFYQHMNWQELEAWREDEKVVDEPCARIMAQMARAAAEKAAAAGQSRADAVQGAMSGIKDMFGFSGGGGTGGQGGASTVPQAEPAFGGAGAAGAPVATANPAISPSSSSSSAVAAGYPGNPPAPEQQQQQPPPLSQQQQQQQQQPLVTGAQFQGNAPPPGGYPGVPPAGYPGGPGGSAPVTGAQGQGHGQPQAAPAQAPAPAPAPAATSTGGGLGAMFGNAMQDAQSAVAGLGLFGAQGQQQGAGAGAPGAAGGSTAAGF